MASVVVEPMNDASQWAALQSDGVTPSTELSISDEVQLVRFGADGVSAKIAGTTAGTGHVLRRALAPLDLTEYEELRLAVRSGLLADGSPAAPFFLELRLGSAALGVDDPANTWQRYLPISRTNAWENHGLDLSELDPAVRSAVSLLQLRCVDATRSFTLYVDDVLATRDEMIADVDAALLARLHQGVDVSGSPVPAAVRLAGAGAPEVPSIQLLHFAAQFSDERTSESETRADFSTEGYRLRPPSVAYDLYYAVEALAETRADQARILEFVLRTLGPRGTLIVAGDALPTELVVPSALERLRVSGLAADRLLIHLRVRARQRMGAGRLVRSVQQVRVDTDFKAA